MPRPNVRVKVHPRRVRRQTAAQLNQNMHMATTWLRDRVKETLNRGQPTRTLPSGTVIGLNPSDPGEPPKKVTSQLQNSIKGEVDEGVFVITGRVGSPLEKARYLELGTSKMAARPYLRPTLFRNRATIRAILISGKGALK